MKTILITDDEPIAKLVLGKLLTKLGHKVYSASTGAEALSLLDEKKNEIELATVDMMLPDMGGEELSNKMREISPNLSLLVISGLDSENKHIKAVLELENSNLLSKPYHIDDLKVAIDEWLF